LPAINQIFFVKARVFYRHAVDLMKALINSITPIEIRFGYRRSFHRTLRSADQPIRRPGVVSEGWIAGSSPAMTKERT
jgi:hypothetical protein